MNEQIYSCWEQWPLPEQSTVEFVIPPVLNVLSPSCFKRSLMGNIWLGRRQKKNFHSGSDKLPYAQSLTHNLTCPQGGDPITKITSASVHFSVTNKRFPSTLSHIQNYTVSCF